MYPSWKVNTILASILLQLVLGELTNLKCVSLDPSFVRIETCILKSVNRTYKYGTVNAALLQLPVTNVFVNFQLWKRESGWKPFLYNVSVDACKFIRNTKRYRVLDFFFNIIRPYTNMVHPCPYNHHVNVTKVPASFVHNAFTQGLPFPSGIYMVELIWVINKGPKANIKIVGELI